jgi:hypothetical protein
MIYPYQNIYCNLRLIRLSGEGVVAQSTVFVEESTSGVPEILEIVLALALLLVSCSFCPKKQQQQLEILKRINAKSTRAHHCCQNSAFGKSGRLCCCIRMQEHNVPASVYHILQVP